MVHDLKRPREKTARKDREKRPREKARKDVMPRQKKAAEETFPFLQPFFMKTEFVMLPYASVRYLCHFSVSLFAKVRVRLLIDTVADALRGTVAHDHSERACVCTSEGVAVIVLYPILKRLIYLVVTILRVTGKVIRLRPHPAVPVITLCTAGGRIITQRVHVLFAVEVRVCRSVTDLPHRNNGFWVKPYSSFESVPLKNGPKVSNINYGTLIGYDSNIKEIKYGWDRVLTGYVGYNGASQRYKGVDTYQNGGILGSTITLYKGNFFNATTLSVGASVGSTTSMFGHEDYTMLLSGIGNKTGYNFEFKDGKFIFQPSMLISYTFVNTFDYTNAAGVKINSDPLHAIQLAPGVKFIMNTKNGWQPYMAVNMVWNALDKQKVMANDVRLPEMSIKPYVEYGMGVQKCFKNDSLTAFGQAMVRNGGRNGVSLTAGLRFKVGKDLAKNNDVKSEKSKKTQKVKKEKVKKEKKICFPKIKFFAWSLSANN